jgi:hypothetical protein
LLLLALENREHFILAHDQVILAVDLDLLARVLAKQDGVGILDVERDALAVLLDLARADSKDLSLLLLPLAADAQHDAADFLFTLLDALNDDAVV